MKKLMTVKNFVAASVIKFAVTAIIFIAIHAANTAHAALQVGEEAPDFTVTDTKGVEHKLESYRGKIVVLEWTNPGCPFVKKHYETNNMQDLQKYALEKGAIWLAINSSAAGKEGNLTKDEANALIKEQGFKSTGLVLDPAGKLGKLYDAKTTPHMFVIDQKGKIAYMGAIDDKASMEKNDVKGARNYVRGAIDQLVVGKEPSIKYAQQYGCSVKY